MAIEVTGRLHVIFETKQVSERFTKRELVVEIADGKYPQFVQFQLSGDRCTLADQFQVNDQVRIEFNLRGREWRSPQGETKYFNSLDIWKLEPARANMAQGSSGNRSRPDSFGGSPRVDLDMPAHMRDDAPRPDDDIPF